MLVNCEWGAFNNNVSWYAFVEQTADVRVVQRSVLPSTPFDNKLDRESINARKQAFEKFISGMYQGEILRNILLHLIDYSPAVLFKGETSPILDKHYGLDTAVMSDIENAQTIGQVRDIIISELRLPEDSVTLADAWIVRWATELVGGRAAKLSGCAVAGILVQTGYAHLQGAKTATSDQPLKTSVTIQVGVDGRCVRLA